MAIKPVETKVLLLSLSALIAVEGLAAFFLSKPTFPMIALGTVRVLETALILWIVSAWGQGSASLGLAPHQLFEGLKTGLTWSALFGLGAFFVAIGLCAFKISPIPFIKTPLPKGTQPLIWFFVVGGLLAPLAEEVFFRGIVYGFLRRWGTLVAIAGTTLFFVGAHSMVARVPVTQIVGGIVFALAYETRGSLVVPITIHVLGNTAIFTLSLVLS
jgi:membrane protease YdiL (CAAX protease family)